MNFYLECAVVRRPIQDYDMLYRGLTIFVDFTFQCPGEVSAVEFYAKNRGQFYFSVWRQSACAETWTLIGYNLIEASIVGAQVISTTEN